MEEIRDTLERFRALGQQFEAMTGEELEKYKAEDYNKTSGRLSEKDGYHCPKCLDRGDFCQAREYRPGWWTAYHIPCECMEIRASIRRMQASGLKNIITDYTFKRYDVKEPWQARVKEAARVYAERGDGWFFLGGQSGAGKTHLCTAICRKFLMEGKRVQYMLWRDDVAKIKGIGIDPEKRQELLERFKGADVLYIDDLFKQGLSADGGKQRPTAGDINAAFEMLNYRYNDRRKLTVISSEWSLGELLEIDEAVGGRICERCGEFGVSIAPDRQKNYRLQGAVTV